MEKNRILLLSASIFLITMLMLMIPMIVSVFAVSGNSTTFNVTLTVNSGSPTITNVSMISDSPNEGTTKIVHFYFNATHPNGVANIPAGNAQVRINQSGTVLTSSNCMVNSTDGSTLNRFDCNITIYYYTSPGSWTINASVVDLANNRVYNTTSIYTNGNTFGISLKTTSITFSGTPGATVGAGENPQQVNNTGNVAYNQINLTAFNLQSGSNIIGAGNFTANATTDGSGAGNTLVNNTPVTLYNSSIAINASRNIYLYASLPVGLANGTYNSSAWVVTVS